MEQLITFDYTLNPVVGIQLNGKLVAYFRPIVPVDNDSYAYILGTVHASPITVNAVGVKEGSLGL